MAQPDFPGKYGGQIVPYGGQKWLWTKGRWVQISGGGKVLSEPKPPAPKPKPKPKPKVDIEAAIEGGEKVQEALKQQKTIQGTASPQTQAILTGIAQRGQKSQQLPLRQYVGGLAKEKFPGETPEAQIKRGIATGLGAAPETLTAGFGTIFGTGVQLVTSPTYREALGKEITVRPYEFGSELLSTAGITFGIGKGLSVAGLGKFKVTEIGGIAEQRTTAVVTGKGISPDIVVSRKLPISERILSPQDILGVGEKLKSGYGLPEIEFDVFMGGTLFRSETGKIFPSAVYTIRGKPPKIPDLFEFKEFSIGQIGIAPEAFGMRKLSILLPKTGKTAAKTEPIAGMFTPPSGKQPRPVAYELAQSYARQQQALFKQGIPRPPTKPVKYKITGKGTSPISGVPFVTERLGDIYSLGSIAAFTLPSAFKLAPTEKVGTATVLQAPPSAYPRNITDLAITSGLRDIAKQTQAQVLRPKTILGQRAIYSRRGRQPLQRIAPSTMLNAGGILTLPKLTQRQRTRRGTRPAFRFDLFSRYAASLNLGKLQPVSLFGGYEPKKKKKKGKTAYDIFIRRFGREVRIGSGLPRGQALKLGIGRAAKTLGATIRLKEAGITEMGDINYNVPSSFRQYRIQKGRRIPLKDVYIQKAKFRLSAPSEVSEIMGFRARAGGGKRRRKKNLFF